jgi:hypothetical protein
MNVGSMTAKKSVFATADAAEKWFEEIDSDLLQPRMQARQGRVQGSPRAEL